MRPELDRALHLAGDAATRQALIAATSRVAVDDEIRRGLLTAVFPRVYTRPWFADDPRALQVAAVRHAGPVTLLSHTTALHRFGLIDDRDRDLLHVLSNSSRHARGLDGRLRVHRTHAPLHATLQTGLPTVDVATALLQSWQLLSRLQRRTPVINAVRRRAVSPNEIEVALGRFPKLTGRAELVELLRLLRAGCESELELWGYRSVFGLAIFRSGTWQLPVTAQGCRYRIDLGFERERLAVELDGRAYHSSPAQWQRDIDRDLRLATIGWQTIRLSHYRLTHDVAGCQRDVIRVLDARRVR